MCLQKTRQQLNSLPRNERIRLLKLTIIDVPNLFSSQPSGDKVPSVWVTSMKHLCEIYNCQFKYLLEPIKSNGICLPGTSYYKSGTRPPIVELGWYPKRKDQMEDWIITFFHELGHRLQHIFYGGRLALNNYKQALDYEKEACRLSYFLYKAYATKALPSLPYHRSFSDYNSQASQEFLNMYYCVCYGVVDD